MTTKRPGNGYLTEEATEMKKKGFLTVRAAAELASVRVDRVYRAIKAKQVRVKLGENAYTRYVHKDDWVKLMKTKRDAVLTSLGITN